MKTLNKIALLTLALVGFSQGAVTVSIKNFSSLSTGMPVVDSLGAPLVPGSRSVSVGYFSTIDFATANTASIILAFNQFGNTSTTFSFNGGFNTNIVATLPANDATFSGKTIYTLVGNASTVATSTLFAIYTNNVLFPTVDAVGSGSATSVTVLNSNVVYGKILNSGSFTEPAGGTFPQAVQVIAAAVPEPSAALLGAIGALGLLRRRRI